MDVVDTDLRAIAGGDVRRIRLPQAAITLDRPITAKDVDEAALPKASSNSGWAG